MKFNVIALNFPPKIAVYSLVLLMQPVKLNKL